MSLDWGLLDVKVKTQKSQPFSHSSSIEGTSFHKYGRAAKARRALTTSENISGKVHQKRNDPFSPHHFANDEKCIRLLTNNDASVLDKVPSPFDEPIPRKSKATNRDGPDNSFLQKAQYDQRDRVMGPLGRLTNNAVDPYNPKSSRSYGQKPSILEMAPLQTKSQSSESQNSKVAFKKYNNGMKSFGTPKKIIPGSTLKSTAIDEIEDYDNDDKKDMKKLDKSIEWSRAVNKKEAHDMKTDGSSTKRSPLADKNRKWQSTYNHYEDSDDSLFSDSDTKKTPKSTRKRSLDKYSDEDEWKPNHNEKKNGSKKTAKSNGVNPQSFHRLSASSAESSRKSPRLNIQRKSSKNKNEVIELMDSDEDSVRLVSAPINTQDSESSHLPRMGEKVKVDAARIAIGSKVYRMNCSISFQPGGRQQYISVEYSLNLPQHESNQHKILLEDDLSISDFKYCDGDIQDDSSSPDDSLIFLSMRITPTSLNKLEGLQHYHRDEKSDEYEKDEKRRFIVVEFRNFEDLNKLIQSMKKNSLLANLIFRESCKLTSENIANYSKSLLKDTKKEKSLRNKSSSSKETTNTILLVYPFTGDQEEIEEAAQGLNEASVRIGNTNENVTLVEAAETGESQEKSVRAHYLTIRDEDRRRLIYDEFLNDTLVDFWMQWIARFQRKASTSVHFFTSHFFTTLLNDGPSGVSSWTTRRDINIFDKKFIFIPINESLHWSLCVVVNAGKIRNQHLDTPPEDEDEIPCILFFDSLKAHKKFKVGRKVREWLNFECKRVGLVTGTPEEPFNDKTMKLFDPRVPYQENSWDCGVYTCRYALGILQSWKKPFTLADADNNFQSLISDDKKFKFSGSQITRMRQDMSSLIMKLSTIFQRLKAEESEKAKVNEKSRREEEKSKTGSTENEKSMEKEEALMKIDMQAQVIIPQENERVPVNQETRSMQVEVDGTENHSDGLHDDDIAV